MVKISNASHENEIYKVNSPFNGNSKNIIFWPGRPYISREGQPENLGKMTKNRETYCYAN